MNLPLHQNKIHGAGLGLRRALCAALARDRPPEIDFLEVAPENWIGVGGRWLDLLRSCTERCPLVLHGLSLNIGGFAPIDEELVRSIGRFMEEHHCPFYSEHLSYCGDDGHMYDLMPIPFTEEAVHHVAKRIRQVQDLLGRRIAMENASYYAAYGQEMSESEFVNAIVAEADCDLLLDVNNIVVNSINHGYDPQEFLSSLPGERTTYIHIAGHFKESADLRVDSHGAPVIEAVWQLLASAYKQFGVRPTLVERDFNLPPLAELLGELQYIHRLQQACTQATDEPLPPPPT